MTHRQTRRGAIAILMLMFVLFAIGCTGFSTPLLSVPEKRATVIITKPPIQIYMSGSIQRVTVEEVSEIIEVLDKIKYYPYKFNDSFSAEHGIGLKSEQSSKHDSNVKVRR